MIIHDAPQGSEAWLAARVGVITGSRFRDCRDRLKSGAPSKACLSYARDVARERCSGKAAPGPFVNAAMRFGTEQEPIARRAYETESGELVQEAGFITTDDGRFGVSVDGLIGSEGGFECKTLVGSDQIFTVLAEGDVSCYLDQVMGAMWLLRRQWWKLVLWCPDLEPIGRCLTVRRIERDEDYIAKMEADLVSFLRLVDENERALRMPLAA